MKVGSAEANFNRVESPEAHAYPNRHKKGILLSQESGANGRRGKKKARASAGLLALSTCSMTNVFTTKQLLLLAFNPHAVERLPHEEQ